MRRTYVGQFDLGFFAFRRGRSGLGFRRGEGVGRPPGRGLASPAASSAGFRRPPEWRRRSRRRLAASSWLRRIAGGQRRAAGAGTASTGRRWHRTEQAVGRLRECRPRRACGKSRFPVPIGGKRHLGGGERVKLLVEGGGVGLLQGRGDLLGLSGLGSIGPGLGDAACTDRRPWEARCGLPARGPCRGPRPGRSASPWPLPCQPRRTDRPPS